MNALWETLLKDFVTSGITNKAIHKGGTGRAQLIKTILNYPNSFTVLYEVEASGESGPTHFSVNGQPLHGLNKGYAVFIRFEDLQNIVPPNFNSLPYSSQQQIIQQVFDKCDAKVQCDCGAFYWQGMFEKDDEKDNTYSSFTGQHGKDIWANRHDSSGWTKV